MQTSGVVANSRGEPRILPIYKFPETERVRELAELYRELFGPDWRVEWNQTVRVEVCED